jgi:P4 family phage/plasmid primase-like protien
VEGGVNDGFLNSADTLKTGGSAKSISIGLLAALLPLGAVLIPISLGEKGPTWKGWQKTTYGAMATPDFEKRLLNAANRGGNIGVILGKASQDLVAIDVDDDALVEVFLTLNPKLKDTLRTRGSKGCQIWIQITDDKYPEAYFCWNRGAKENALEWRCSGINENGEHVTFQSVIAGVHPNGNNYQILNQQKVIKISYYDLVWPDWIKDPPHIQFAARKAEIEQRARKKEAKATGKSGGSKNDPSLQWLRDLGIKGDISTLDLVAALNECGCATLGEHGESRTDVECPWSDEHSTKDARPATAVLHSNEWPTFHCFHAHCAARKLQQVCEWLESKSPGIITRHCKKQFIVQGGTDFWAPIEGEVAAKVVADHIGDLRCVGKDWYIWKDGIWSPAKCDVYRKAALDLIPETWRTECHSSNVIRRIECEHQVSEDQFRGAIKFADDGKSVLIAIQGGVLCISADVQQEPKMLGSSSEHGFTQALPVTYDPNQRASLFLQTLASALPDAQDRECLLDVLGTALIPDGRYEACAVCIGEGGSSKSTVMAPIERIFGDTCSALGMADLCHPNGYSLAKLKDKLINLASELTTEEIADTDKFKRLVSGEAINAREIYGEPFTLKSHATLVFLANSLPRFRFGTDAEIRRLKFIRFGNVVSKENRDETLKARIAVEAPGVFAMLVARAWKLLSGGKLAQPGDFSQETYARFEVSNDPIGQFVKRECLLGPDQCCGKAELVTAFDEYREQYGISDKLADNVFLRNLYERFPSVAAKRVRLPSGVRGQLVFGITPKAIEAKNQPVHTQQNKSDAQLKAEARIQAAIDMDAQDCEDFLEAARRAESEREFRTRCVAA